jgi:predicted nucleic acid-binding protein
MYMVGKAVVDASVVAKWFINEPDSHQALILHDQHISGKIELHAPSLMVYEVLNALLYSKVFSSIELEQLAKALLNYRVVLHSLNENLAKNMTQLAHSTNTTIYDAAYVALAEEIGCKFYTADVKLIQKIKKAVDKAQVFSIEKLDAT